MIREMSVQDKPRVMEMMYKIWPDFEGQYDFEHHRVFVAEDDRQTVGFVSFSIRPWVDGADIAPVPHLEGLFVESDQRRRGFGRDLVRTVEAWCRDHGYSQLTSDTLLENVDSIAFHQAIGFTATEQIQYF